MYFALMDTMDAISGFMDRGGGVLWIIATLLLVKFSMVFERVWYLHSTHAKRVKQTLASYAITGLTIEADGRELRLSGEISRHIDPDHVAKIARQVWGVRTVEVDALRQRSSMLDADDPLSPRFDASRIVRLGGDLSNPMDAGTCQRTMARLAAAASVRFEAGGASPMLESYPVLNDLASVAYQCPQATIVIGGHTDASGDRDANLRLSQARAEAVERFFYLAGIPAQRMQIIAYGDSQPVAGNATAEGRAANRRITFDVRPVR